MRWCYLLSGPCGPPRCSGRASLEPFSSVKATGVHHWRFRDRSRNHHIYYGLLSTSFGSECPWRRTGRAYDGQELIDFQFVRLQFILFDMPLFAARVKILYAFLCARSLYHEGDGGLRQLLSLCPGCFWAADSLRRGLWGRRGGSPVPGPTECPRLSIPTTPPSCGLWHVWVLWSLGNHCKGRGVMSCGELASRGSMSRPTRCFFLTSV
jgi:hypothetical protein